VKLSDEKIDFIRAEIDKSAISLQSLKDDLLDHFCCFVEHEMRRGLTFEEAFAKALREVCPNGLDEIQRETIFLLTTPKIMVLKKTM
jgi:hypothetical protein